MKDGVDAVTTYELFNLKFTDDRPQCDGVAKMDLDDYDTIVFEEVYCNNIFMLSNLFRFIQNTNKTVIANGDVFQLKPVKYEELCNNTEYDSHYRKVISYMFPHAVMLHQNKRCKTEEDKQRC